MSFEEKKMWNPFKTNFKEFEVRDCADATKIVPDFDFVTIFQMAGEILLDLYRNTQWH